MPPRHSDDHTRLRRVRWTLGRLRLFLAFGFTFCAGVNAATHHWWDAAGEILIAVFFLWLSSVKFEAAQRV